MNLVCLRGYATPYLFRITTETEKNGIYSSKLASDRLLPCIQSPTFSLVPVINSQFRPTGFLKNAHLQTVLASKVFKPKLVDTKRERIETPDGDFIDINIAQGDSQHVVALFHGLAGCVESPYIQGVIAALKSCGFQAVLMHWRGCSGEPNRLGRAYHSGASDDIDWFIRYLDNRFADANLYAVGYSLGGNALLKYLGEQGDKSPLKGAMAVSPPLVLSEGANQLDRGFAKIYQRYLLNLMRKQHEKKRLRYPDLNVPVAHKGLNTFWKFDNEITAPLHGYAGVDDYYTRCSARQYLSSIHVPTRILSARDDPFFTQAILPDASELSDQITLEISEHGGHVGFLSESGRWLDSHVAHTMNRFKTAAN